MVVVMVRVNSEVGLHNESRHYPNCTIHIVEAAIFDRGQLCEKTAL